MVRPVTDRFRDIVPDEPTRPCVLCDSDLGLPLEVGGYVGHREVSACRSCELHDYDALVALVDDLHESQTRTQGPSDTDCPVCLSPVCDCHRPGRAVGAPDPDDEPPRFNMPRGGAA